MARMEMDCILKKWGYRFQVHSFCLGKEKKKKKSHKNFLTKSSQIIAVS